jgi:hypothetical protein
MSSIKHRHLIFSIGKASAFLDLNPIMVPLPVPFYNLIPGPFYYLNKYLNGLWIFDQDFKDIV